MKHYGQIYLFIHFLRKPQVDLDHDIDLFRDLYYKASDYHHSTEVSGPNPSLTLFQTKIIYYYSETQAVMDDGDYL